MGAGMGMMLPQMMKEAMTDSSGSQAAPGEAPAKDKPQATDEGAAPQLRGRQLRLRLSAIPVVASCQKAPGSVPAVAPRLPSDRTTTAERVRCRSLSTDSRHC